MNPNASRTAAVAVGPVSEDDGVASTVAAADQACDDPANYRIRKTSRIQVYLAEWGPRASDVATRLHISVSAVIRMALAGYFKDEVQAALSQVLVPDCQVRLGGHLNAASAHRLNVRARAAGMSQGMYLDALIMGEPPTPLPADHAELRSALHRSNDQLAVALADLNGFTRLVAAGHVEPPVDGRASLDDLIRDVRMHLGLAAQVLAQLKPPRRTP